MRLLVITQKVDIQDDNLGFFHRWLEKLSEKTNKLYVVCNSLGSHHLPPDVIVYSLGKEKGYSKLRKFFRFQRFLLKCLFLTDGIFVHMGPIYVIAVFPLAFILRKKIILWYGHKRVSFLAKIAEKLVFKIFTPSKDSFAHKSKKIVVTGHGVDVGIFRPAAAQRSLGAAIFTAGRITPVKDLKTLVEAANILVSQKKLENIKIKIAGTPIEEYEKDYFNSLQKIIKEKNLESCIEFLGGVSNKDLVGLYQESDIFVNMQGKGGAGKAVLEAMACGVPVVLCTTTFNELLGDFKNEVIFEEKNPQDFAEKILNCLNFSREKKDKYSKILRGIVERHHNLENLTSQIINSLYNGY